ncbi:hypothetical protein NL676_001022 [Syzygium grande]|nr:hypothetical protein NL676_001022 [Syzygium grande]
MVSTSTTMTTFSMMVYVVVADVASDVACVVAYVASMVVLQCGLRGRLHGGGLQVLRVPDKFLPQENTTTNTRIKHTKKITPDLSSRRSDPSSPRTSALAKSTQCVAMNFLIISWREAARTRLFLRRGTFN